MADAALSSSAAMALNLSQERQISVLASDGAWPTLRALTTVSANLASRPLDERVRTLRTSNEAVARTLLEYPVAARFLKLLGFVEVEGFLSVVGTDETGVDEVLIEVANRWASAARTWIGLRFRMAASKIGFVSTTSV